MRETHNTSQFSFGQGGVLVTSASNVFSNANVCETISITFPFCRLKDAFVDNCTLIVYENLIDCKQKRLLNALLFCFPRFFDLYSSFGSNKSDNECQLVNQFLLRYMLYKNLFYFVLE